MSQIATGYGLSSSLMGELLPAVEAGNYSAFWSLLSDQAIQVTPDFSFSGSVVAIVIEYLQDKGVELPINDTHPTVRAMLSADLSLAMCCDVRQAEAVVAAMQELQIDEGEFESYFMEFTGEAWDEAGSAFAEGLDYIRRTLLLALGGCDWVMLFNG